MLMGLLWGRSGSLDIVLLRGAGMNGRWDGVDLVEVSFAGMAETVVADLLQ